MTFSSSVLFGSSGPVTYRGEDGAGPHQHGLPRDAFVQDRLRLGAGEERHGLFAPRGSEQPAGVHDHALHVALYAAHGLHRFLILHIDFRHMSVRQQAEWKGKQQQQQQGAKGLNGYTKKKEIGEYRVWKNERNATYTPTTGETQLYSSLPCHRKHEKEYARAHNPPPPPAPNKHTRKQNQLRVPCSALSAMRGGRQNGRHTHAGIRTP